VEILTINGGTILVALDATIFYYKTEGVSRDAFVLGIKIRGFRVVIS
jgi:hypothetical protein